MTTFLDMMVLAMRTQRRGDTEAAAQMALLAMQAEDAQKFLKTASASTLIARAVNGDTTTTATEDLLNEMEQEEQDEEAAGTPLKEMLEDGDDVAPVGPAAGRGEQPIAETISAIANELDAAGHRDLGDQLRSTL